MDVDQLLQQHEDAEQADGEGVWSPEIERAFQEALAEYPACGRRKHILQDEGGGKMYGRNELIARYIYLQTGKLRTRKQVSSHIQVLARRKAKGDNSIAGSEVASNGTPSPASGSRSLSASSHSNPMLDQPPINQHSQPQMNMISQMRNNQQHHYQHLQHNPYADLNSLRQLAASHHHHQHHQHQHQPNYPAASLTQSQVHTAGQSDHQMDTDAMSKGQDHWLDRPVASQRIRLVEFSGFVERPTPPAVRSPYDLHHHHNQLSPSGSRHPYVQIDYSKLSVLGLSPDKLEHIAISQVQDKFPELGGPAGLWQRCPSDAIYLIKFWAELNKCQLDNDDQNSYFGFSSHFETPEPLGQLSCSTRACSYGQQVVEKVDIMRPSYNLTNGRYSYSTDRSPMCEFMVQFIRKLRRLPSVSLMNSVLENFTILQVITSESTSEVLLCLALIFEIDSTNQIKGPQHHVYKLTKD